MISFVGAGPGAPDLITLKGARLLSEADVVVYAGSLVNPALLDLCRKDCEVHDSSGMTLEQVVDVLVRAHVQGKSCVRLHTGDPALYGAHGEQMAELDARGVPYEVVPGVSSLFGAAAALRRELTVPEVSQSVIVTRVEGRTPMPSGEQLRDLASHGCTLALFLSAGLLSKAQAELLAAGRDAHEPAAIVVRATWPDEAVHHCTVGTLAACGAEHGMRKTALVLVGACVGEREIGDARSRLYDAGFSHEYRAADPGTATSLVSVSSSAPLLVAPPESVLPLSPAQTPPKGRFAQRRAAVVAFTRGGVRLARRIACELEQAGQSAELYAPERLAAGDVRPYGDLATWTARMFGKVGALVFVSATGIAVRAIAPHAHDKLSDPAVVCVDEAGTWVVPLLSGHVGGANELARRIARSLGAQAAISTATDVRGVFAVDEWAARQNMMLLDRDEARRVSAHLLEGERVGFASDFSVEGPLPAGIVFDDGSTCDTGIVVSLDASTRPFAHTLRLVPRTVTVGVGCKRGTPAEDIEALVEACLREANVAPEAARALATIDIKRDERGLCEVANSHGWDLTLYSADELAAVPGSFSSSEFVLQTVGVGNVCERASCAEGAHLLLAKRSARGVTVALAAHDIALCFETEKTLEGGLET